MGPIRIGTASWSVPAHEAQRFDIGASGLARYATRFDAVEINTSFYRSHRPGTYARWAASVPDGFRFAVKLPRTITHDLRLSGAEPLVTRFLDEVGALEHKLGPILIQLPPSLGFDAAAATAFLDGLRSVYAGALVCEPRHASWFEPAADNMLRALHVGRVAADPAPVAAAGEPGGWSGIVYRRLHGSPRIYRSAYTAPFLERLVLSLGADTAPERWCVFDNTALGAATGDALMVKAGLEGR